MSPSVQFVDEHLLHVGGRAFHCGHPIRGVPAGRLPVEKPQDLVQDYIDLCDRLRPQRIVELGIYKGGSTALLNELAAPDKLVAVDLTAEPAPLLVQYVQEHLASDAVRPYFGVDQADRTRLQEIVHEEFAGTPLDLVIDDASHLYHESRSSFETLFPMIRPGGLFIIEDWRWQHQVADALAGTTVFTEKDLEVIAQRMVDVAEGRRPRREVPLSRLVLELALAHTSHTGVVSELTIGPYWAQMRRGEDLLDSSFRLTDLVPDRLELLTPLQ